MTRFPILAVAVPLVACGAALDSGAKAMTASAAAAPRLDQERSAPGTAELVPAAAPAPNATPTAPPTGAAMAAAPDMSASGAAAEGESAISVREMFDIEARVEIVVANAERAAKQVSELCRNERGMVTEQNVQSGAAGSTATLTLRVPVSQSEHFFEALHDLGEVTSELMKSQDIGKAYFDARLRLANLEAALHRYQELLQKAANLDETMQVEAQLERIRGEIEQVKGNLRWMKDRAARATVYLTLRENAPVVAEPPPTPVALFYPGLRASYLLDLRGEQGEHGYYGAGISLRKDSAVLELDGLRRVHQASRGLDALIVTVGADSYSELLGGGRRRTFNPYLGLRLGYARFPAAEDAFVFGASLGLELYKSSTVRLDAGARALGFLSSKLHLGVTPALGVNLAF